MSRIRNIPRGRGRKVARILPLAGMVVAKNFMMTSGGGESESTFWYIVRYTNSGKLELHKLDHFDQECADDKIKKMRIPHWNERDPDNPIELVVICSNVENNWLNSPEADSFRKIRS